MKKKPREPKEQLNNPAPVEFVPEEVTYDLEDIIREFGGWTRPQEEEEDVPPLVIRQEPEPAPEPIPEPETIPVEEPDPVPEQEAVSEPEPEPEAPKADIIRVAAPETEKERTPKFKLVDLSGDTIRFKTVTPEDLKKAEEEAPPMPAVEMPPEPEPQPDPKQLKAEKRARRRSEMRLKKQEAQRRKAKKAALRAARREQPEVVYPSVKDACADYGKTGSLRLRLMISAVLCAISAVLLVLGSGVIGFMDFSGSAWILSLLMMALLLVQSVLSYEVFLNGVYRVLRLQFDLGSMLTLTVMICLADGLFAMAQGRIPFCTAPGFLLLIGLWSVSLEKKAKWRTLKSVLAMEQPVAAAKEDKAWHGLDCVFRTEGSLDTFTAMLETPDAAKKVMRVYAPIAAVASLLLAAFSSIRGKGDFLWSWAALLTAAMPVGGFIACCRPFSILAKRLQKAGTAICGWKGAKILSGECGIVIEDADLFPKANISMNGMKMYSDLPTRQVVGYATAVIQAAGSGLLPLFEEVMKQEDGRRYRADSFRQYEGGGLGAEIRGDVVLLGSLAFMRLMGVHVPEGTRVQSALYISVNKELVGVFALTYQPSADTKAGLVGVMHSNGLTPILATRDFMITPSLVKKRYKVSVDRMEFPVVAERIKLSAEEAGQKGKQGALMSKESFLSFASAVTGGRLLRRTVHSAVALAVFGGIVGLLLMAVLTYLGSAASLSAWNLLLFHLIWSVPTLLTTGLVGKT